MATPLVPWDSDSTHANLVWRSKLDNRYLIEVQRVGDYTANLYIFDHEKDDKEIACWPVTLTYGARFGPDVDDVDDWMKKTEDFIDNTYPKTINPSL